MCQDSRTAVDRIVIGPVQEYIQLVSNYYNICSARLFAGISVSKNYAYYRPALLIYHTPLVTPEDLLPLASSTAANESQSAFEIGASSVTVIVAVINVVVVEVLKILVLCRDIYQLPQGPSVAVGA